MDEKIVNEALETRLDGLGCYLIAEMLLEAEAETERQKGKISLALLELAHIEGEKTPTEIRIEQALKGTEAEDG